MATRAQINPNITPTYPLDLLEALLGTSKGRTQLTEIPKNIQYRASEYGDYPFPAIYRHRIPGLEYEPGLEAPMLIAEPEFYYPYGIMSKFVRKAPSIAAKGLPLLKGQGGFVILQSPFSEATAPAIERAKAMSQTLDAMFPTVKEVSKDLPVLVEGEGPGIIEALRKLQRERSGLLAATMYSPKGLRQGLLEGQRVPLPSIVIREPTSLLHEFPHGMVHMEELLKKGPFTKLSGELLRQEIPSQAVIPLQHSTGYATSEFPVELIAGTGEKLARKQLFKDVQVPEGVLSELIKPQGAVQQLLQGIRDPRAREVMETRYVGYLQKPTTSFDEYVRSLTGMSPKDLAELVKGDYSILRFNPKTSRWEPISLEKQVAEEISQSTRRATAGAGEGKRPSILERLKMFGIK